MSNPLLPITWDNSECYTLEALHLETVRKDIATELSLNRYSKPFRPDLLDGMYSMLLFIRPKLHTDSWRVVVDHSAEPFSLNSTIPREKSHVVLDNVHDLGIALWCNHTKHLNDQIILFKSNVSQAYRRLPMHPLWKIRQIVSFEGKRYVDQCDIWGNRDAGHIWCAFMGLVLWITREIKKIKDVFGYINDNFSWDFLGNLDIYEPYDAFMPEKQVRLLQLWDELGIPHNKKKQLYSSPL